MHPFVVALIWALVMANPFFLFHNKFNIILFSFRLTTFLPVNNGILRTSSDVTALHHNVHKPSVYISIVFSE